MTPRQILFSLIAFCTVCFCAALQVGAAEDQPYRRDISIATRVISQEIYEQTYTDRISIASESAIAAKSQTTLSLNEHFFELVSLDAHTEKPDGRRIPVAADQILVSASPNAPQLGVFQADVRIRTIVFPSVEVGDVLTYTQKVRALRPAVPGGIDAFFSIPPHARYGDVTIELDTPVEAGFSIRRDGMTEAMIVNGDRKRYLWRLPPKAHVAPEAGSVSYIDYSPFVSFSNRASDDEIGRWFYAVASEKARVTPDIQKLADEVTEGLDDRREQARAIYDFVSTKIRYFFLVIGQGGWIPHDASTVLSNRFGDCKDHVTLMRAMLAAKGIDADYVLLTSAVATYRELDLPNTHYDHVILYLPDFDTYADPTSAATAFGVLPMRAAGKPTLHINASGVTRRKAPNLRAEEESIVIRARAKVSAEGRLSGQSTWIVSHNHAAMVRSQLGNAEMRGRNEFVTELLRRASLRGKGSMAAPRAGDHVEPFTVEMSYEADNPVLANAADGPLMPFGPILIEMPNLTYWRYASERRSLKTICFAQTFDMSLDIELHDSLEFGTVPLPVTIETDAGSFSSSYAIDGKRLHINRTWRLQPSEMVCSADTIRTHIMPVANTMTRDSHTRLLVRRASN